MFMLGAPKRRLLSQVSNIAERNAFRNDSNIRHSFKCTLAVMNDAWLKKSWLSTVKALSSYNQPIKILYASVSSSAKNSPECNPYYFRDDTNSLTALVTPLSILVYRQQTGTAKLFAHQLNDELASEYPDREVSISEWKDATPEEMLEPKKALHVFLTRFVVKQNFSLNDCLDACIV